jgi:acetyl esterase/lipase
VHGASDNLVSPREARALADAARAAGGRAELRVYPGVAHVDLLLGLSSRLRGESPLLADIAAFVGRAPGAAAQAAE